MRVSLMAVLAALVGLTSLAACDPGKGFLGACTTSDDCKDAFACMGGLCLRRDACDALGCDWATEVCVAEADGAARCVPSCFNDPLACADTSPALMNAHPVVGYMGNTVTGKIQPTPVCACLASACSACDAATFCVSLANGNDPNTPVEDAMFPADAVAAGGECIQRP
ncbi:MAG: hypothetical protein MUC84_07240 [Solirubrobacteraceae bacterium]|jgi:hypothetical protein|nr:hypothetical protein [Solirubrobacteraceae bacterium]